MTTYSALTTLKGADQAELLGTAMERLTPEPTGVGVFEIEDNSGLWEVGGYFQDPPDQAGLALLAVIHGAHDFVISKIDDRDWVAQVRRELHPVHAGRFTVYGAHDSHNVGPHRIGLRIEAAMAFGTGHHGTTRGCLMLLAKLLTRGYRPTVIADIGCGTGVLAMAAVKAVRARGLATDLDPIAVATSRENLSANGCGTLVPVAQAAGLLHPLHRRAAPYDLIFANILAAPLKRMARQMSTHLESGGYAILSGLLKHQTAGVEATFRGHGLICQDRLVQGEWRSLLMRKHGRRI